VVLPLVPPQKLNEYNRPGISNNMDSSIIHDMDDNALMGVPNFVEKSTITTQNQYLNDEFIITLLYCHEKLGPMTTNKKKARAKKRARRGYR
jgi:hypothetical protein